MKEEIKKLPITNLTPDLVRERFNEVIETVNELAEQLADLGDRLETVEEEQNT